MQENLKAFVNNFFYNVINKRKEVQRTDIRGAFKIKINCQFGNLPQGGGTWR